MTTASCVSSRTAIDLERVILQVPGYNPHDMAGGCTFDPEAAGLAIDFFHECLTHVRGELAGKPFLLEPWQQAVVANMFGWKRLDGTRRYRTVFLRVPRKNGKTPMAAGVCLFTLLCDGEPGAEIYSAAADREQAALTYAYASGMVDADSDLSERCEIYRGFGQRSIVLRSDRLSSYRVLSSDAKTKHGRNTHVVVVDEVHAHQGRELIDAMRTSTSARRNPLIMYLTTRDHEGESICNELDDYACSVRDNGGDPEKPGHDPSFLPVLYGAEKEDDWTDEKVWFRANPNLGISKRLDYMQEQCRIAKENPAFENEFRRLDLNVRTEQAVRVIPMGEWDACAGAVNAKALEGRPCFGGLDLSTVSDLSAFVLCFPNPDGVFDILPFMWCPKDGARERERVHRVPYITWARSGNLELTPGNRVDYRFVRRRIREISKKYKLVDVGYDPYNASHLAQQLNDEDGVRMVEFRQGFLSMNEPTKNMLRLLKGKEFRHGGHPVLRWCATNMAARTDPSGNLKPDKARSAGKIDAIVAMIMALGRAMANASSKQSVYEKRGVISLGRTSMGSST